jgi:ATP-binding cassette subfamily B protein
MIVHDSDLSIPQVQKVGIVGPSGAGSQTFINLLQRLYDVQTGEVLIGGVPVTAVSQDSLRAALAVVPQEITLFHRTIAENIRFARPSATDAEVFAAAAARIATSSSAAFRMATQPWSASAAPSCPAASGSGSGSPARS